MSILPGDLVSVIIPTFNRERIIPISLESALAQSYKNIEIIVVDDHSNDDTETVVKQYQDSRIRFIRLPTNSGGAAARNAGINAARGEYIAFLDSDDAWMPNKLEMQYGYIQNQPDPQKVVCYTQVFHSLSGISAETSYSLNEKFYLPKRGKEDDESVGDYILCNRGKTLTSTLMLHREIALSNLFKDNLRKHQDWDFCIRLEAKGARFLFLEKPLTIWNGDPTFEHVGRSSNYKLSELWLKETRRYLSFKAVASFSLEKILPSLMAKKMKKSYAQKILIEGCLSGRISLKLFVKRSIEVWT